LSWPCLAALSFCRRVFVRVFLPASFLSPLGRPPRRTSHGFRTAANIQYTVILARARDCVGLLSTLRADATAKTANPTAVQVRAGTSQRESQNAKACVSHASGRGRGCDRGCETGDRSDRRRSALAAGNELAEESRYALRQCRSHVSARGATDREEIPDPGLRWRGNRAAAASLGCDAKRHRRVRPHAHLVQYR